MTREQGTGNREQGRGFAVSVSRTVLGNFTFRYLCGFFSVHLLSFPESYLIIRSLVKTFRDLTLLNFNWLYSIFLLEKRKN
ncbi:MAG: hypothetical protein ACK57R_01030 [Dolichospermum sp.]|nr:hypothetical protein [Anabaena sp. 49628_E55]